MWSGCETKWWAVFRANWGAWSNLLLFQVREIENCWTLCLRSSSTQHQQVRLCEVFYIKSVNEIIKNYFNIFLRLNIFGENQIELHKASCRAPLPPSIQPSLTHRSKLCVDFWPQTNSTLCRSLCLVGVKYQVSSIKFSVKYQNQTKLHVEKNKASQRAPLAPRKNSSLCCSHCLAGVKHQVSNIKYQVWSV